MRENYIGEIYGCYSIIGVSSKKNKEGHILYHVRCNQCKKEFDKTLSSLKRLKTNKCFHKENLTVKICKQCQKEFFKGENEKQGDFNKRTFCSSSCSVTYSNLHKDKKNINPQYCLNCGEIISISNLSHSTYNRRKFCSNKCQQNYRYKEKIKKWKDGNDDGLIGNQWIDLCNAIRRYIFNKYNFKCAKCGWSKKNPFTDTLPLEIEHIDGDATNNKEDNLILLCPNCHSLTATYRGANKGKGKRNIKWLSRDYNKD